MTDIEEASSWIGRTAVDNTGQQIGFITQIWADDSTSTPEWASVKLIGSRGSEALVPLAGAGRFGGGRRFAFSKQDILDAPRPAHEDRLEFADKEQLSAYYGAPDAGSDPGPATWIDRLEDAADGGTVREIRALLGENHSSPAAQAPVAQAPVAQAPVAQAPDAQASAAPRRGRRFGRKAAPSMG